MTSRADVSSLLPGNSQNSQEENPRGEAPFTAHALHANTPTSPPLPWLAWTPGERVVVRYRGEDGLYDALGDLLETAPDHVVIRTRKGDVRVDARTMVTGKKVPPPPSAPLPH